MEGRVVFKEAMRGGTCTQRGTFARDAPRITDDDRIDGGSGVGAVWKEDAALGNVEAHGAVMGGNGARGVSSTAATKTTGTGFDAGARRGDKRKPRTYSQDVPSQHCHTCSRRSTQASRHAVRGNLLRQRCRKTICTACFATFRWYLKTAREGRPVGGSARTARESARSARSA